MPPSRKEKCYSFFEKLQEAAKVYPFYVIETGDSEVVGFGLLRPTHFAEAFRQAAELTYFISPLHTRKGLGAKLLHLLTEAAKTMGVRTLLASISALNEISLSFHKANGFSECGRFVRVGTKFGEAFDLVWMQNFIE